MRMSWVPLSTGSGLCFLTLGQTGTALRQFAAQNWISEPLRRRRAGGRPEEADETGTWRKLHFRLRGGHGGLVEAQQAFWRDFCRQKGHADSRIHISSSLVFVKMM